MEAMLSFRREWGETHTSSRALAALRRRVRKSLIGSVMGGWKVRPRGSYPTPGGQGIYQEDLMTPGILPLRASSRNWIRETPNLPMKARGRPLMEQRLRTRTLEELRGSFCSLSWALKNSSSEVDGLARRALRSARVLACLATRRWRFLLRSMAEVLGMAVRSGGGRLGRGR